ncbi:MAG: cysteine--tRNA ligase [Candidatus Aureabacteria bacterium]|nr:cysteine--tRNA ligase [Candidatus Auribacterota bacterium]
MGSEMEGQPKLIVYNTATRSPEEFQPLTPGEVSMYVCGPTVYDDCHVGHGRSMVAFDIIVRWLEYRGYRVRYVRNITDIEDKIIKRAAERSITCTELAEQYIHGFREDTRKLSLRMPDVEPRATEHIPEMLDLISKLWEKKLAYQSGSDVYFDVGAFPHYGKLSGRDTEDLLAGARVEVNEKKKNPLDFVLWKGAKEGEPQWPSPWGPGRPGWHIECSAMSKKYLGDTFDIHGGGQDLVFPHHENEVAQSEGATGKAPVRYWLHNAFVTIDKTKMSKSLGNFFTLKEVFQKYDPRVVRFFLLSKHYRSPVDFSAAALSEAGAALGRIDECVARLEEVKGGEIQPAGDCHPEFARAMDDDFNTTEAMGVIFGFVNHINHNLDSRNPGWEEETERAGAQLKKCCEILGIELKKRETRKVLGVTESLEKEQIEALLQREVLSLEEVDLLLKSRNAMRHKKEFALADRIRQKVQVLGFDVRDEKGKGSIVRRK